MTKSTTTYHTKLGNFLFQTLHFAFAQDFNDFFWMIMMKTFFQINVFVFLFCLVLIFFSEIVMVMINW